MSKITATFNCPAEFLTNVLQEESKKTLSPVTVNVFPVRSNTRSVVVGNTQEVMFLIGAVAARGEDSLLAARVL